MRVNPRSALTSRSRSTSTTSAEQAGERLAGGPTAAELEVGLLGGVVGRAQHAPLRACAGRSTSPSSSPSRRASIGLVDGLQSRASRPASRRSLQVRVGLEVGVEDLDARAGRCSSIDHASSIPWASSPACEGIDSAELWHRETRCCSRRAAASPATGSQCSVIPRWGWRPRQRGGRNGRGVLAERLREPAPAPALVALELHVAGAPAGAELAQLQRALARQAAVQELDPREVVEVAVLAGHQVAGRERSRRPGALGLAGSRRGRTACARAATARA